MTAFKGSILPRLAALTAVGFLAAAAPIAAPVSPPAELQDGWPVGTVADAGLDETAMGELTAALRDGSLPEAHAVLVEHDGRLVYETYLEGNDERWGDPLGHVVFGPESLHDLRSVTKSVTSALLGIALGGNYEKALDAPIPAFFPDLQGRFGAGLEQVTLRHVLTMTAGLEWNEMSVPYTERENDEIQLYYTKDPVAMVLARPLRDPPGQRWYYNGGLTQVLAGIIERRTGKPLDAYAEEALFAPLGITDYEWLGSSLWPDGTSPSAASGLRLKARDLAKIGSLFLNRGQWQGQQIVPAEWVALSTQRHVEDIAWSAGGIYGYGFMWYPGRVQGDNGYPVVRAMGNGNQRIFILPDQKLAVTVFAGRYNRFSFPLGEEIRKRIAAAHRGAG